MLRFKVGFVLFDIIGSRLIHGKAKVLCDFLYTFVLCSFYLFSSSSNVFTEIKALETQKEAPSGLHDGVIEFFFLA